VFAVFWFVKMDQLTGNPLFPYFNQYFHSALALASPYRDERFLPHGIGNALLLPFRFTWHWQAADDLPFRDARVLAAYVTTVIALLCMLFRWRAKDPLMERGATRIVIAFAGITMVAWIAVFAIYRYILALEMLAPIVIVAALGLFPIARRTRFIAAGVIFLALLVYSEPDFFPREPLGDPYITADIPPIPHPDSTTILMTGEAPLGYLVPLFPHQIPFLRIDGWMLQPGDGTRMTRDMRARVAAHKGALYLLSDAYDMARAREALAQYGLAIRWLECRVFETNLPGVYRFCPLARKPGGPS
jgi:hypothetical protein